MTAVLFANVVGQPSRSPVALPPRRRRLSTIARRCAPVDRPFVLSVHRKGELASIPTDRTIRYRTREVARQHGGLTWSETLVGPHDVVLITTCPLGGGASSAGGGKSAAGIGLTLASIALIALAAPVGGMLTAIFAPYAGAVQAGAVIGGLRLGLWTVPCGART